MNYDKDDPKRNVPKPWLSFLDVRDANGERIITVWGRTADEREALARFIIDAGERIPHKQEIP
jgi:hypothetical protein